MEKIHAELIWLRRRMSAQTDELMTVPKAAEYLGFTEGYLYKLTSKKVIPFHKKLGKKILFTRMELYEWVTGNGLRWENEKHEKL